MSRLLKAHYRLLDGSEIDIEYDADAPCMACGLPVVEASMGGTALCPWCDTGYNRTGDRIAWPPRKASPDEYRDALIALGRVPG